MRTRSVSPNAVRIDSWLSEVEERSLANDVLDGLTRPFKEIPPKHFYDARGSALFEQICELPEYYPTRTERVILEQEAESIIALSGAGELVELGSGSPQKAMILLDAMAEAGTLRRYIPLDVSEQPVREAEVLQRQGLATGILQPAPQIEGLTELVDRALELAERDVR